MTYEALSKRQYDFESGIPGNGYPYTGDVNGTTHTHPNYDPGAFFLYDLGIVVLDTELIMGEYGQLPAVGAVDPLVKRRGRQDTSFKAVGYGLQRINPVFVEGFRVRLQATLDLVTLRGVAGGSSGIPKKTSIWLTNNANTGGYLLWRFWRADFWGQHKHNNCGDFLRTQR